MIFNTRSVLNSRGVHPDLIKVATLVCDTNPFIITEGLRSIMRQEQMIAQGKSFVQVPELGRHITGHAIDVAALDSDGKVTWEIPAYKILAAVFAKVSGELGIPVVWGGNFVEHPDYDHFELSFKAYPVSQTVGAKPCG